MVAVNNIVGLAITTASIGWAALSGVAVIEDYHSHNAEQLGVEGMVKLLTNLPFIRKEVFGEDVKNLVL